MTQGKPEQSDSARTARIDARTPDQCAGAAASDVGGLEVTPDLPDSLPAGPIPYQVIVLALPMLGEQLGNFMVGFVDMWLAGTLTKEASAAVGTGGYLGWWVSLAFSLVGTGTAALVARSYGAGDRETANRALHQALVLALTLGLLVAGSVYAAAPALAEQLLQIPAARGSLVEYIRIDAIGYILFSMLLIGSGALRAAGDMRTPMAIMLVVNVVNAVVSAALVFGWWGPLLGVRGIAIGTVVARCLGGVLTLVMLYRGLRGLRLRIPLLRPDPAILGRLMNIGIPAFLDVLMLWGAHFGFVLVVANSGRGEAATVNYAAHLIGMRMEAISFLPAVAWMTAASTLVGQYLGARQPRLASRSGHQAALQAAGLCTLIGLGFFLLAGPIYGAMTRDPAVQEVGARAFRLMAFVQPILAAAIVYTGALRGAGDTRATMVMQFCGGWLLRLPGAWLFGIYFGWGLIGCWCGMWLDNIAKFLMSWLRFVHGGWKKIEV